MPETHILTQEGYDKLKKEYKNLLEVERPRAIERVKLAREMGSLDDNPEYDAARKEQGLIEKRIVELDEILKNARVIEKSEVLDVVGLGSTVEVEVEGEIDEFTIVGTEEANPSVGKISHESPVGRTLLGKGVGEVVEVKASIMKSVYKILKIR